MYLLIKKRRARRSDICGARADQRVLTGDGPLPTVGDHEKPRPEEAPSPAEGLIDEGHALVHCQRCGTDHLASAVWTLSTHPTTQGVVTYFRCPAGHADFHTTRR
jgi:hypothetical protein